MARLPAQKGGLMRTSSIRGDGQQPAWVTATQDGFARRSPRRTNPEPVSIEPRTPPTGCISGRPRLIEVEGMHSLRDVRGYPVGAGTTRWGVLFRSGPLHGMSQAIRDRLSR